MEPTSTADKVLNIMKRTLLIVSKDDPRVAAVLNNVSVTSMWGLKNRQQVAKVSVCFKQAIRTRLVVGYDFNAWNV